MNEINLNPYAHEINQEFAAKLEESRRAVSDLLEGLRTKQRRLVSSIINIRDITMSLSTLHTEMRNSCPEQLHHLTLMGIVCEADALMGELRRGEKNPLYVETSLQRIHDYLQKLIEELKK